MRRRKARVARLGSEEENVLPRRHDPRANDVGEQLGQPGAAGEDEPVRDQPFALGGHHCAETIADTARRLDRGLTIGPAARDEVGRQHLHRSPRHQRAHRRLEDADGDAAEIGLGPAS